MNTPTLSPEDEARVIVARVAPGWGVERISKRNGTLQPQQSPTLFLFETRHALSGLTDGACRWN